MCLSAYDQASREGQSCWSGKQDQFYEADKIHFHTSMTSSWQNAVLVNLGCTL